MLNTYLKTKTRIEVYRCDPGAGEKDQLGPWGSLAVI